MATRPRKDGSGKGKGQACGLRRNKNANPCKNKTVRNTGKGTKRK